VQTTGFPGANRITVVGSINMDLIVRVPALPEPGQTVIGHRLVTAAGGKGANQAVAARRTGGAVAMVGRVGRDTFGDQLLDGLRREGIDVSGVRRDEAPTGVALITVDEKGENTIALAPGANRSVSPADVALAEGTLKSSKICLAQLEIPVEAVLESLSRARSLGVATLLNVAPAVVVPPKLWHDVTIAILNEGELDLTVGRVGKSGEAALVEQVRALLALGPEVVIVTRGGDDTLAMVRGQEPIWVAPPRVRVVDTVGAGDAFVGTFAATFQGISKSALYSALSFANAAGALATTKIGAQPSLPLRADVEALLNQASASRAG